MISINLNQDPKIQFINLFNTSNKTNYSLDELGIRSWHRNGDNTSVIVQTLRKEDRCEIPTAIVNFKHVPLDKLFERNNHQFKSGEILDAESNFDLTKFLSAVSMTFGLMTNSIDYTAVYDMGQVTFSATDRNLVYTGQVVFDVVDGELKIIDLHPFVLKSSGESNYIRTYYQDFNIFQVLELDEHGQFSSLDKLNSILTEYYGLKPITSEMKIVHRKPDANLGDRTNCTDVIIVSPNDDLWDRYYFHFNRPF